MKNKNRRDTFIVISKESGQAVLEFFTESLKQYINIDKYTVMTAREYLPTVNKKL